jgi:tRNA 5-methylaminomethyl-2-thiouridine biosynthesis bifunctional protein
MRSTRLTPAVLCAADASLPAIDADGWRRAQHVFLHGNGLPGRWQGRERFTVLEAGFGLGHNFLATWSAWRRDPQRCRHLFHVAIEKHPLKADDFATTHGLDGAVNQQPEAEDSSACEADRAMLAGALLARWPELTPGLHLIHFEGANALALDTAAADHAETPAARAATASASPAFRVTLMLALGDVADCLAQLMLQADAFYLDDPSSSAHSEVWPPALLSRLYKLAVPGATVASKSAAKPMHDVLTQAGFVVSKAPGFASQHDMMQGIYSPRHHPDLPPGGGRSVPPPASRTVLVIGAGLAGACTALALCREGWHVTVVDQAPGPARGASGNPAGLFHCIVHGEDGVHTRTHRAAALSTWRLLQSPLQPWPDGMSQLQGLLRLAPRETSAAAHALLDRLGWPDTHLRWLDAADAAQRAQVPLQSGAWCFAQAGMVNPSAWVPAMLQQAREWAGRTGGSLTCEWGVQVLTLQQEAAMWRADGMRGISQHGPNWRARAHSVVLCNAQAVNPLLSSLPPHQASTELPLSAVRGQTTLINAQAQRDLQASAGLPCPHRPALPVAGSGYALSLPDGGLLLGATTQHHDTDPTVRTVDHQHNLRQAVSLGVLPAAWGDWAQHLPDLGNHPLLGRTEWRATTPDRLPLVGALPCSDTRLALMGTRRLDQVRLLPRNRGEHGGLYTVTGLGSRGITWAGLLVDLVAHWVAGAPCPIEVDLRDAMDPARFMARQHKRGA